MDNPVSEAIAKLGGQREDVAAVCRVSRTAVDQWLRLGYVPRTRYAVLLSWATGISVARLAGLSDSEHDPGRPQRAHTRAVTVVVPPAVESAGDATATDGPAAGPAPSPARTVRSRGAKADRSCVVAAPGRVAFSGALGIAAAA